MYNIIKHSSSNCVTPSSSGDNRSREEEDEEEEQEQHHFHPHHAEEDEDDAASASPPPGGWSCQGATAQISTHQSSSTSRSSFSFFLVPLPVCKNVVGGATSFFCFRRSYDLTATAKLLLSPSVLVLILVSAWAMASTSCMRRRGDLLLPTNILVAVTASWADKLISCCCCLVSCNNNTNLGGRATTGAARCSDAQTNQNLHQEARRGIATAAHQRRVGSSITRALRLLLLTSLVTRSWYDRCHESPPHGDCWR